MTGRNVGKRHAAHITEVLLTMVHSLTLPSDRGEPLEFVCGAGQMIKGFDAAVADMEVGEIKGDPPDAGGSLRNAESEYDPSHSRSQISRVPEDLEVGQQVYLTNQSSQPFPVKVTAKDEKMITLRREP